MEELHKQVMPLLLRRTKDEVLSDLPEKIIQDRYCDLSPIQLKLYSQFFGSHVIKELTSMVNLNEDAGGAPKAFAHVFQAFLYIIEKDLFQTLMKNITDLRLDASVQPEKRFEIVKAFNSDPTIDALLLTTQVGGLGLKLTSADTLVFMEHDWNPMRDHQVFEVENNHALKCKVEI